MTDIPGLHRRALEWFGDGVHQVGDQQWNVGTPCVDWDVRTLVNHVAGESYWTPPLFEGKTVAEVGDRFDGDLLGDDPKAAWDAAAGPAIEAVHGEGAMDRIVHVSFGDFPGSEYAMQMFADHLIHGWDLAKGIGAEDRMDPELVDACTRWFSEREHLYRGVGAVAARPEVPEDADPQTKLLAMFGRTA
jgi:uncharacterized protein (TIGR03086 family)